MTNPRQATNDYENDYAVAELEASQTRPTQVSGPRTAVFELPGESSVLTQSNEQTSSVPAGGDAIPQANPWPFYLDDASSTVLAYGIRPPSNGTSGTSQEPANPWPYHGVESDNLDNGNALEHRKYFSNFINETVSSSEADEESLQKLDAGLLNGKNAVALDGVAAEQSHNPLLNADHEQKASNLAGTAFQPAKSEDMAPTLPLGQASTHARGSASNSLAIKPESQVSVNVHRDGISENLSMFPSKLFQTCNPILNKLYQLTNRNQAMVHLVLKVFHRV